MAYAWAGKMDVSVKLDCGCTVPRHDASDLFLGVYAWCPEHGDAQVVEVLDPPVLERVEHEGPARVWRVGAGSVWLYVFADSALLVTYCAPHVIPGAFAELTQAELAERVRRWLHREPALLNSWRHIVETAHAFLRKEAAISDLRAAVREVYPANGR